MVIRSHEELDVWKGSVSVAMDIFWESKRFPVEERYSLTDQIRRASRSVSAQISEAWRKRRYPAAFVSKLNDAEAEAAETQNWIEYARLCQYWGDDFALPLKERYEIILGQLVKMASRPDQWCEALADGRRS